MGGLGEQLMGHSIKIDGFVVLGEKYDHQAHDLYTTGRF